MAEFTSGLQAGHDERDADLLNGQLARNVVWGTPYGALVEGYDQLLPIHVTFQSREGDRPRARYEVRRVAAVRSDVVIATWRDSFWARRSAVGTDRRSDRPFSEMAMSVLV